MLNAIGTLYGKLLFNAIYWNLFKEILRYRQAVENVESYPQIVDNFEKLLTTF